LRKIENNLAFVNYLNIFKYCRINAFELLSKPYLAKIMLQQYIFKKYGEVRQIKSNASENGSYITNLYNKSSSFTILLVVFKTRKIW